MIRTLAIAGTVGAALGMITGPFVALLVSMVIG